MKKNKLKQIKPLVLVGLMLLAGCSPKKDTEALPAHTNRYQVTLNPEYYNVAFLIMDGTYNTELTAPFDIFQHTQYRKGIKAMNVFTVAKTLDPITTFEGVRILPDFDYTKDSIPRIDILVVPSAEHHLDSDLEDETMIDFVRKADQNAQFVTSHCDGSFVLAKAGLLNEVTSTTFPSDIPAYKKNVSPLSSRRQCSFCT